MLVYLVLSQRSLSYPHLFFSFFFLLLWLGGLYCFVFQIADPFFCNLQSANDFLLVYFFIAVIVFFRSDGLCLIFSVSLLKFSLSSSILLPSSMRVFMSLTLNSLSGKLLIFTLFNSFPEVLSYSFFWQLFFVFSLFLTLFVCFYVLGISATPPSLERVALCRRCPVGPVTQSPNVIKSRCSRGTPAWTGYALLLWLGDLFWPYEVGSHAGWLQDPAMTPVGLHLCMVGPQDDWLSGLAMTVEGMLVFRVPWCGSCFWRASCGGEDEKGRSSGEHQGRGPQL